RLWDARRPRKVAPMPRSKGRSTPMQPRRTARRPIWKHKEIQPMPAAALALIPFGVFVPLFAFISVAVWADYRTRERDAFYRSEVLKKLAEVSGPQAQQVIDALREQEQGREKRRREGMRLGGLVVSMVGLGLTVMLFFLVPKAPVWTVGLIPILVGTALLFHVRQLE